MIEKIYYNETEFIKLDIPEEGNIGAFMSGGADSSLMAYLLAITIQKHNLKTKVYPVTAELLARPFNLRCASDVTAKITELTGFKFDLHPCFIIPNHTKRLSDNEKVDVMSTYTRDFANRYQLKTLFNGLTANPPLSAVQDTEWSDRQKCRDDINWRKEQEKKVGLTVPFIHIDKRVIGQLYKKYDLLDSLLPLTRSCEGERDVTHFFTKVCFDTLPKGQECWWCREREYGFADL